MPDFDTIIIGTGQAGPSLAFRLARAGMKVAVVERHLVGGTCVNAGAPDQGLRSERLCRPDRAARRRVWCGDRRMTPLRERGDIPHGGP